MRAGVAQALLQGVNFTDAALNRHAVAALDRIDQVLLRVRDAVGPIEAKLPLTLALRSATESRDLATRTLAQAQDRFRAGVASNVEVIQAQEAVAAASEQFIDARYGFLIAKAMLAGSVGTAEVELKRYLGGPNR